MNLLNARRLPAEWEPQAFIQYTFPHRFGDWAYMYEEVAACFYSLIEVTAGYVPVLVVGDERQDPAAIVPPQTKHPVTIVKSRSNDTWARDHGAITVLEQGRPLLLDFTFNGWGGKFDATLDDALNRSLHGQGVLPDPMVSLDFVLEGGAIESDGEGTLLTTSACLLTPTRNPGYSKEDVEEFLKEQFGLKRLLWLEHGFLEGDDTDSHIDTLARFCDRDTIAYVRCDDPEDNHYLELKRMEDQLRTFRTLEGKPYRLVPLPWPDACYDNEGGRLPATYANFLITNGAVLVPLYGVEQDRQALKVLESCFTDREVVGINCRPLIEQHGSLHCVTMQYPDKVKASFL